jgi:ferredoxin
MAERRDLVSRLKLDHRLASCIACGKCSAACAMAAMYADISLACSPRAFVQGQLHADAPTTPPGIWRCVQCGNCTATCPEGVDPAGLIRSLRDMSEGTEVRRCVRCLREIPSRSVAAWLSDVLPTAEPTGIDAEAEAAALAFLDLCPICRRLAFADAICRESAS